MMRAVRTRITAAFAAAVMSLGFAVATAAPASASAAPAWSIAAGSEPTALPKPANEVQEVTVTGGAGVWALENLKSVGAWFPGEKEEVAVAGPFSVGTTAAELQTALEGDVGAGNVTVSGGQPEGKPYRIEFTGELAASRVRIGKAEGFGPTVSVHEATRGQGVTSFITTAINTGAAATAGTTTVVAHLPSGVIPRKRVAGQETLGYAVPGGGKEVEYAPATCELSGGVATCTLAKPLIPGDGVRVTLYGYAEEGATETSDEASVSGGGAAEAKATHASAVGASVPFGIEPGSLIFATSNTETGTHPNITTGFAVSTRELAKPAGFTRAVNLSLPPGVIGNPQATRKCTMAQVDAKDCPNEDALGIATARIGGGGRKGVATVTALVYNVVPNPSEPAAFAFNVGFPVRLDTSVGPEGGYHVHINIEEVTQGEQLLASYVTLWGVPTEYNGSRTEEIEGSTVEGPYYNGAQAYGVPRQGTTPLPFLDYPTQCASGLSGTVGLVSWPEYNEGRLETTTSALEALTLPTPTECALQAFAPSVEVLTSTDASAKPAGYTVKLKVPQTNSVESNATPDVRNVEVEMPEGTVISPSGANGLAACSEAQFGLKAEGKGSCPDASIIGKVKITTPLLALPLEGHVYVGEPACAACTNTQAAAGEMVRLLLEAEGSGVTIKLEGYTEINSATGRLKTVFAENPQLPFSELELSLKDGANAPLANPSTCGNVVATANITAWTAMYNEAGGLADPGALAKVNAPAIPISGCTTPGFTPSMEAGMTGSSSGGAFTPFAVTLSRPDGQQALKGVTIHTPPGLLGMLSKVQLCGEAQANAGTCPAASQIGATTAVVGPGTQPYEISGGKVYLTQHYGGGAFGLSIVVPAQAGPFHLAGQFGEGAEGDGNVVVRGSISVDPTTAALTIATNPMPEKLDGIPLGIDHVIVNINKAGFMFNPTNCNAMSVTGTIDSWAGASANVSTPFQAHNCATLPFHPRFKALAHAKHSRQRGAYFHVVVESGPGQANIASVHTTLPIRLPAEESTLKKACLAAQFAKSPAGCPAESKVGTATVYTPVLPVPMRGQAIFVSHGGAAYPDLDLVLKGDGVTVILVGNTHINSKTGLTSSFFRTVPDVPITRFDLVLPQRKYPALAAPESLCYRTVTKKKQVRVRRHGKWVHITKRVHHKVRLRLKMPTTITGQNGAVVQKKVIVAVTGCGAKAKGASLKGKHHRHNHKKH